MQKENQGLEQLCRRIEEFLQWGSSGNWTEQDFEDLSEKIQAKTQVRLSVTTLKRIWGRVRYDSSPHAATLNALAKFLDYPNWREFLQSGSFQEPEKGEEKPVYSARLFLRLVVAACLILFSIALISLLGKKEAPSARTGDLPVVFQSRPVTEGLPNSVVFDYDAIAYHSDSVYIQQNWDPTRREKVPGSGTRHTSIYYYPGFFKAKLMVNGLVKKESDVFIQSKGWLGIVGEKPVPAYLGRAEMDLPGALGVSSRTLSQKIGSPIYTNHWVYFTDVRVFPGLDPRNFEFMISLRNTSTIEESPCRQVKIYILGKESAIIIPLAAKGCISDLNLLTGEQFIRGKENDLNGFGCDFTQFQQLTCEVRDQRLKIRLNGKLIMDTVQRQSIGDIIGLRIGFEGPGEIRELRFSENGKVLYADRFRHGNQPLNERPAGAAPF